MGFFSDLLDTAKSVVDIGSGGAKIAGAFMGGDEDAFRRNAELQKEFAQQGIRWRVEDAKAAGIHPLFALGASLPAASPITSFADDNLFSSLGSAGQDLSRAIDATRTASERDQARLAALTLRRAELENDLLTAQIAKLQGTQVGPPMPSSLQDYSLPAGAAAPVGRVDVRPLQVSPGELGAPWQDPGFIPDYAYVRTPGGGVAIVPSKDVKERIEDQPLPELLWFLRNGLLPNLESTAFYPSRIDPGPGRKWKWSFRRQEFRSVPQTWEDVSDYAVPREKWQWSMPGFSIRRM